MSGAEERISDGAHGAPEYIPAVETHLVTSHYVKQSFHIQVMRPTQRRGEMTRFPVIYLTDGNFAFDALKGISYGMQMSERDAPRFILVGIGYPGHSPLAGSLLRARDMTFPGYPKLSTKPLPMEGVLMAERGTKDLYGAEEFQRFLQAELIPLVDAKYLTISGDRTYFGHSLGGGFGLFTLFTRSDLFKNYIISSPGLIYHGESSGGVHYDNYDFVLQQARAFIASGISLRDIGLYMSVGTEEEFEPAISQWRITSSFYRMARLLRDAALPGLRLTTEAIPGETHMTVWSTAFIHGVRALLGAGACERNELKS